MFKFFTVFITPTHFKDKVIIKNSVQALSQLESEAVLCTNLKLCLGRQEE